MLSKTTKPKFPPTGARNLRRARRAFSRQCRRKLRSILKVFADPGLPVLMLGALAAAFVAAFVFDSPPESVFAILLIGFLTAFVETKTKGGDTDR